ncbi:chemotaxis protein CheA [Heliorestis convoluta]|uniref:Chemotaxis protein CheA n=1 Tax=Heliorestis convoluta TaxID=356322 RepID=A0A5Q2MVY6_9FIRM|nr:chemotaxis protein CheA [Heliorestis convoluta]QGG46447.1 chemotaxis protein CheA [Heliorestis convoluta]
MDFQQTFLEEAEELLIGINEDILALEAKSNDVELVNKIFRAAHTIKGSANLFALQGISELTHLLESILDRLRNHSLTIDPVLTDLLLAGFDQVEKLIGSLNNGLVDPQPDQELMQQLYRYMNGDQSDCNDGFEQTAIEEKVDQKRLAYLKTEKILELVKASLQKEKLWQVLIEPAEDLFFTGHDLVHTINQLTEVGPIVSAELSGERLPEWNEFDPLNCYLDVHIILASPSGTNRHDIVEILDFLVSDKTKVLLAEITLADLVLDELIPQKNKVQLLTEKDGDNRRKIKTQQEKKNNLESFTVDEIYEKFLADEATLISQESHCSDLLEHRIQQMIHKLEEMLSIAQSDEPCSPLQMTCSNLRNATVGALCLGSYVHTLNQNHGQDKVVAEKVLKALPPWWQAIWHEWSSKLFSIVTSHAEESVADFTLDIIELLAESASLDSEEISEIKSAKEVVECAEVSKTAEAILSSSINANVTFRVEQKKIDRLMELIGELIIGKNTLPYMVKKLNHQYQMPQAARELKEKHDVIDRISKELQNAIMDIRMLPLSFAFGKFNRFVRDLARQSNKIIKLEIRGEETAIDKNLVEALSEPLLHLVRNAIDHGLETIEERLIANKSSNSILRLEAWREGERVFVQVQDDGRGIDANAVKAKAVAQGLITSEDAKSMPYERAIQFIFHPGLSTAKSVTDLSGRGVGMDVVYSNIQSIGGQVRVMSEEGKGTSVLLELPLTMTMTQVLQVMVDKKLYGISLDQIQETVRLQDSDIQRMQNQEIFVLRDRLIPIIDLAEYFHSNPIDAKAKKSFRYLVILKTGIALQVDGLIGRQEVVIKPIDHNLNHCKAISGAAILGDGTVMLIINGNSIRI